MNKADKYFIDNIIEILEEGCVDQNPRPKYESDGAPAHSQYITQVVEKYNITKGEFPITNLRPINWKNAIKEILWIYQDQSSDLKILKEDYNIHWWDSWKIGDGTIGQRYGATVSRYDLIDNLLYELKNNKHSRRHIINLWQEKDFKETEGLLPCAYETIWSVRTIDNIDYLDMTLIQRSSDYLVAGHINKIQYAALLLMVAHHSKMIPGNFVHFVQNLHIYDRHKQQAEILIERYSKNNPILVLNAEGKSFYEITIDDFTMLDYSPVQPQLKFELGV